jgi:hypothetical protein
MRKHRLILAILVLLAALAAVIVIKQRPAAGEMWQKVGAFVPGPVVTHIQASIRLPK